MLLSVVPLEVDWDYTCQYGTRSHIATGFGNLERNKNKIKIIINTEHTDIKFINPKFK